MYENVKAFSHPAHEARIAKTVAARTPADYDHEGILKRLESLDVFHNRYRTSDVGQTRVLLERHSATIIRAQLVAAHIKGETPGTSDIPQVEIATILLAPFAGPNGLTLLVGKLSNAVAQDEAELVRMASALQTVEPHDSPVRALLTRQVTIENRLPGRKAALEGFRSAFPVAIAAVVGDQTEQLVAGLAESRALSGRVPTVGDGGIVAELAEVDRQLAQLGAVNVQGPTTARLQGERAELTGRLEATRTEHAATIVARIRAEVDQLMAGSLEAYGTVFRALYEHKASFPPGLADRYAGAGLVALGNASPCLWSSCLESRDSREF